MATYKMTPGYGVDLASTSHEAYATLAVAERLEALVGVVECMAHDLARIADTLKLNSRGVLPPDGS